MCSLSQTRTYMKCKDRSQDLCQIVFLPSMKEFLTPIKVSIFGLRSCRRRGLSLLTWVGLNPKPPPVLDKMTTKTVQII